MATDFSTYDEPRDPCCYEEPDHTDLGYPKPDVAVILEKMTEAEIHEAAAGWVTIAGELGRYLEWGDTGEMIQVIAEDIADRAPDWLPSVTDEDKATARWWCDVLGVDRGDDIAWTAEEEA